MGGYTRRTMLRAGAGAAVSLALPALPAWANRLHPDVLPFADRAMGELGTDKIEHVVLVMMENHSLDNVLGTLRRRGFDGLPRDRHGRPRAWNPDGHGGRVWSHPVADLCPSSDHLTQNWNSSHHQYDNGRNDGFVTNVGGASEPMGYVTPAQLPVTHALAERFPVSDRFFCSVLGQTLPNRRYYFSATSSGQVNDDNSSLLVPAANGTIFDRLDAAKLSWRVYYGNTPSPFYFPNFRNNALQALRCEKNPQFFRDAADGKLPAVSYVEENFAYQSEENPQDIAFGEAFVRSVAEAVMHGPLWPKTALFICYDEHGGWYDHVPPPPAVAPDDIPPDLTLSKKGTYPARFNRYGFRVPLTVVSPWARAQYVSHRVADLTSILAFIEHHFNLPPMTRRDAAAWDLRDMFDFRAPRFARPPALPPAPDIGSTLAKCRADGKNPPTDSLVNELPGP